MRSRDFFGVSDEWVGLPGIIGGIGLAGDALSATARSKK